MGEENKLELGKLLSKVVSVRDQTAMEQPEIELNRESILGKSNVFLKRRGWGHKDFPSQTE